MKNLAKNPLSSALRRTLVTRVQAVFNDRERGETPVTRSADALYDPNSVIWRVHGDVTTMMIGGVTALLLQMLHPAALAGVWDHSSFRNDMLGRLRRTARFIAVTTYAERPLALAAIEKVGTVDIYKTRFKPMRNVLAGRDERMLMKLVVDAGTGRVLGCHILGPDAAEIVQMAAITMKMGATKSDFDRTMALHPSAAEELVTLRDKWVPPL